MSSAPPQPPSAVASTSTPAVTAAPPSKSHAEAPRPKPNPTNKSTSPPTYNIPLSPRDVLHFGTVESDGTTQEHILSISNQARLAEHTWNLLHNLTAVELPLTVAQFTRMWKTLIYFRAQQVDETFNRRRRANRIILDPNILAPAPLIDVLDSLGSYADPHSGITHYVCPPTPNRLNPELWTLADSLTCRRWTWMMLRFKRAFTILPLPNAKDIENRPLPLTSIDPLGNDQVIVRCKHLGPTAMDGIVRAMNEELFAQPLHADDCNIRMTPRIHTPSALLEYCDAYRLEYVP